MGEKMKDIEMEKKLDKIFKEEKGGEKGIGNMRKKIRFIE